ncbi:hypothetical protein [Nonomuraea sp. NPDC049309]
MTVLRQPYWHDSQAAIYHGDAQHVLSKMLAGSADCASRPGAAA